MIAMKDLSSSSYSNRIDNPQLQALQANLKDNAKNRDVKPLTTKRVASNDFSVGFSKVRLASRLTVQHLLL
eukprot:5901415-Amphidinium_carterae.1